MFTPSGRFSPNTRLCLTISDYHRETWNPSWSVATILIGLLSYMLEDDVATGGIKTSDAEKQQLAIASKDWNSKQDSFRHNWSVKYFLKPPEKTKAEIPPCDEWNIFNQSDTDDNIVDADDEDAIEG
ncbi:Ubiquitin-conjugating enzyme E2 6 [Neolecta irregularis DAH-3]|uniref:Ubiquitin-conjugating enzyme E2 6 n=1 Tax=Neolecta irregularis (strain DAH-3) TaxID=1198029 RepID=A0A1U7LHS3_NEOID|nr:Ubiquitin-conjugating enzyme E2 6 [Neolecta irregularis DAH-3]|eukprot:OLL22210.1 Ubiquitin-conjugating enzyme E2 6 [Neolecta irregularis DAH-3]